MCIRDSLYTVELKKEEIETKPYVKFTDESGKLLEKTYYFGEDSTKAGTDVVSVTYKAGSVDTFLYGATELQNDDGTTTTTISDWGTTPGNESLKDKTLYFDNQHFPVKEGEEMCIRDRFRPGHRRRALRGQRLRTALPPGCVCNL